MGRACLWCGGPLCLSSGLWMGQACLRVVSRGVFYAVNVRMAW